VTTETNYPTAPPIGQEALGDYPALVARCREALNLG
jgi:hypothetical protein